MRRTYSDTPLPLPNPNDWLGRDAAMHLLGVSSHVTIGRLVTAGTLTAYRVDGLHVPVYWRAEVTDLANARARAGIRP